MFESLTDRSRDVLEKAQRLAKSRADRAVGPSHLLLALLDEPRGVLKNTLVCLGLSETGEDGTVSLANIAGRVKGAIRLEPLDAAQDGGFTPEALRALELARHEADDMACGYVGPTHILLGLVRAKTAFPGMLNRFFPLDDVRKMARQSIFALGARAERAGLDEIDPPAGEACSGPDCS